VVLEITWELRMLGKEMSVRQPSSKARISQRPACDPGALLARQEQLLGFSDRDGWDELLGRWHGLQKSARVRRGILVRAELYVR
jgi:hypothetical protein